jgi:hypothetical protein
MAENPVPARDIVDFDLMAERDGVEAFVSGEDQAANPFKAECALHAAWLRGWLDAQARHDG